MTDQIMRIVTRGCSIPYKKITGVGSMKIPSTMEHIVLKRSAVI